MPVPFTITPAKGSKTFSIPDEFANRKMSLPALWDYHMQHSPNHPLFVHDDGAGGEKSYTWLQAGRATHRAARIVLDVARSHGIEPSSTNPPPLGLLAVADTLSTWALITGIVRAGYSVFLISVRNSPVAVTHLLKATGCKLLFVSHDKSMNALSMTAIDSLDEGTKISTVPTPRFEELYLPDNTPFEPLPPYEVDLEAPGFIAHSSGSTSFPKPRTLKHKMLINWSHNPYYFPMDICGLRYALHTLPLFHMMGFMSMILWPSASGTTVCTYRPQEPPILSTPELALKAAIDCNCDVLLTVPSNLEEWSRDPESVQNLKRFIYVHYAGGPLQKSAGDLLIDNGVVLKTAMGATEYGTLVISAPENLGKDWEYFKLIPSINAHFVRQEGEEEIYECFIVESDIHWPCVTDTVIDGKPAYSTNDLMMRHPTDKTLWKMYGRTDDQIMHSTGEKTNPGPLETIINGHPLIKNSVIFGRAQFQAGLLVDPIDTSKFDPANEEKLVAFRNEIWPVIEKASAFAPQHSRIFKEMILVTSPSIPFQYTPKGTPRRQIILNEYADLITALYQRVAENSSTDVEPPASWNSVDTLNFVKSIVKKVMDKEIGDEDDIFQSGADSLSATSIRNSVTHAFRVTGVKTAGLGQNFVYSHPTIALLTTFLSGTASGGANGAASAETVVAEMTKMVEELTANLHTHKPDDALLSADTEDEVVLVTGTTGALGSLLLAKLLAEPTVKRVYAVNRPSKNDSLLERQKKAFVEQGLDVGLLGDDNKVALLETDTASHTLGFSKERLAELHGSVTCIIHNAWRVDFNLTLPSFKPLLRGVRNFVDFALESPRAKPPRILFTSSVATAANWTSSSPVPEEVFSSPVVSLGTGYGQSKWVAERILQEARIQRGLETGVIRVGQLCGSRINGNWNPWEWFPAIVRTAQLNGVKSLPDASGTVPFLPTDLAATAIVEMRNTPISLLPQLTHLLHPKPVRWRDIINPLANRLSVPIVKASIWLKKLEEAKENATAIKEQPAFQLIDFYRVSLAEKKQDANGADKEALGGGSTLVVKNVLQVSQTLGSPTLEPLGEADVDKWLGYWKQIGVLQA